MLDSHIAERKDWGVDNFNQEMSRNYLFREIFLKKKKRNNPY